MNLGNFYFLLDDYFDDFPDLNLMRNVEYVDGQPHDRPCYYAFYEEGTGLYWMIPFSSRLSKFEKERNKKIRDNGECDTILFGEVLGFKKAFLIQNMCPILPRYIKNGYMDKNGNPVGISGDFEKQLIQSAKKILALQRKCTTSYRYIFPDILSIQKALMDELKQQDRSCE